MQASVSRLKIIVHGTVQGVGFRPFVFNLAERIGLGGFVCNNGGAAEIEIEGSQERLDTFLCELSKRLPKLACIDRIETQSCPVKGEQMGFQIVDSKNDCDGEHFVPPDAATCDQCLRELFSPSDRRYLYPFINCIECGPRFTIIESLPYDREGTTMQHFKMCAECLAEYREPSNRRFHAQPNACHSCGPQLFFKSSDGEELSGTKALDVAIEILLQNQALAIKALGGFHLIGNAQNLDVVKTIRELKSRRDKPLAIMFADLSAAEKYCHIGETERRLLESVERPIVLLRRKKSCNLPDEIAPFLDEVGAMLPSTPLHHLLCRACDFPLIATSANERGYPILTDNQIALKQYGQIGVLFHDREIHSGYDDSIVRSTGRRTTALRRARGLAPGQLRLPFKANITALAVGGHLKNTFCLGKNSEARLSQHLGDIETMERLENYEKTLLLYEHLFDIQPQIIAHDLHPHYQTTLFAEALAKKRGLPLVPVQHHHAHAVSVMAEHKIESALAVVFDGTGLGTDGNLWGGEFLHATYGRFERLAHLENIPMPGGEAAIKSPWRMALGFVAQLELPDKKSGMSAFLQDAEGRYGSKEVSGVKAQIEKKINCPLTSSCGRLFDAVSALIVPGRYVTYEGQAAMELEALARKCTCSASELARLNLSYKIEAGVDTTIVRTTTLFHSVQEALKSGYSPECVARAFHHAVGKFIVDVLQILKRKTGNSTVCLAGGVFQNTLLSSLVENALLKEHFQVFFPDKLPVNDGGLSFGQLVVALSQAEF